MDRTQYRLTGIRQFSQEPDNVESSTRVEAGGGLIKEHQEFRLGRQLDTDSQSLSLFLVQTLADLADDRTSNVAHFEQIDDRLAVRQLLFAGNLPGLTQKCRELQCLADSGCGLVDVHLLGKSGCSLEGLWQRAAIN